MPRHSSTRPARLLGSLLALSAVVALSVTAGTASPPPSTDAVTPVASPTNAAKIFRWGNAQIKDEFHGALSSAWAVSPAGRVRNQHGMLTLNATATSGTVVAALRGNTRRVGRWEARVRSRQYGTGHTPYHVIWELVPSPGSAYHCGAHNIVLTDYPLGARRATFSARNTPRTQFTATRTLNLGKDVFHTYAVEVTKDHISWFVDTRVIRTEKRPQALNAATYSMRFRMLAPRGARMNPARMQMDWVRYYTLERKSARSIAAPAMRRSTYGPGC